MLTKELAAYEAVNVGADVVPFVSILAEAGRCKVSLPVTLPESGLCMGYTAAT